MRVHDATATAYSNGIAATELQQLARVNVLYLHILEFPARIQPSTSIAVSVHRRWPATAVVRLRCPVTAGGADDVATYNHPHPVKPLSVATHTLVVARDGPVRSVARRCSSAGTRWFKVTSAAPTTTFTHDRSNTLIGNNRTGVDNFMERQHSR